MKFATEVDGCGNRWNIKDMHLLIGAVFCRIVLFFPAEGFVSGAASGHFKSKYYSIELNAGVRKTLVGGDDRSLIDAGHEYRNRLRMVSPKIDQIIDDVRRKQILDLREIGDQPSTQEFEITSENFEKLILKLSLKKPAEKKQIDTLLKDVAKVVWAKENSETVFEIDLEVEKLKWRAILTNKSKATQNVLYEPSLQPSRLELYKDDKRIEPFDSRSIEKYDNTVYCRHFKRLEPGQKMELGFIEFKNVKKRLAGRWGSFEFEDLEKGVYSAQVVWESDIDTCIDEKIKKLQRLPSVWLGQVKSSLYMSLELKPPLFSW